MFDDNSDDEFDTDFPTFDASLGVSYEDALRLVRGYLRSYSPATLPDLLECCDALNIALDTDQLHRVYYGPLIKPEPKVILSLLRVFGYQAMLLGFDLGPVKDKVRHLFFLATKGRLGHFKKQLADFDADSL
ncbi:hypothetical protein GCM10023172_29910 [Hymenobacter ginsengisoli]|uniref:Uncharacterized protein n=1 Tax=Hymenobacter ginsengisoli TaxID=1051626 RepID=A0ABP8QIM5_9BACT|nr:MULTISPECIES: hypothetical protein [unclassified Hymenobacter]MBO2033484.1 hypothetical protein [Hymenobacter sp. BT559]